MHLLPQWRAWLGHISLWANLRLPHHSVCGHLLISFSFYLGVGYVSNVLCIQSCFQSEGDSSYCEVGLCEGAYRNLITQNKKDWLPILGFVVRCRRFEDASCWPPAVVKCITLWIGRTFSSFSVSIVLNSPNTPEFEALFYGIESSGSLSGWGLRVDSSLLFSSP